MKKVLLLLIIFWFYYWTATEGTYHYFDKKYYFSHFNYLTISFLEGKLEMPLKPPAELLALPNPYDPDANKGFRANEFHDLSLYKGKVYLYFGPVPAVTLYLPYHLVAKFISANITNFPESMMYLPNPLACLIFTFGTVIWAALLITYIKKKYFPEIPEWIELLSIATIGYCNLGPYLLRRPWTYEIAIASGMFFLTGGIYFLCLAINKKTFSPLFLFLGSLLLGLAIGCRINLIFSAAVVISYLLFLKLKQEEKVLIKFSSVFTLLLPVFLCLTLLAVYNYSRFNNIFETGFGYQLGSLGGLKNPLIKKRLIIIPSHIIMRQLYYYFFKPPNIDSIFPYVHADTVSHIEKIAGTFTAIPFTLLIFIYLLNLFKEHIKNSFINKAKSFQPNEFYIILLPTITNIAFITFFFSIVLRYVADYLTLLIITCSLIMFHIYSHLKNKKRSLASFFFVLLVLLSIIFGVALSIEGCYKGLIKQNPEVYNNLSQLFSPISDLISNLQKPGS